MATSIRGKDWVFNALWAAASSDQQDGSSSMPPCVLNIPFTTIFKDGQPHKALQTDPTSGKLVKISLERVQIDRLEPDYGFKGTSFRQLRAFRKLLGDFSSRYRYLEYQEEVNEPFIAKVIYTDNQIEDISERTLDILLRNENWRLQVMMIQGYVPVKSTQSGLYSKKPHVRSLIDAAMAEAADQFSKSIAKYIERAYAVHGQSMLNTNDPNKQGVSLHVDNMTCLFGLDPAERLIFLYSEYTAIEIENNRRELESLLKNEKTSRELSAAEKINEELVGLLKQASQRGLSVESSFRHFDPNHNGFFDTEGLIEGLAKLGIGITHPVGENLLQMIGDVGCAFVTFGDFERYLNKYINDSLQDDDPKSKVSPFKSPQQIIQEKINKSQTSNNVKTKTKKLQQLYPPKKETQREESASLDIETSQIHNWEDDVIADTAGKPSTAPKERGPLPLPEHWYTTKGPPTKEEFQQFSKSIDSMPTWTSSRTRRALKQLESSDAYKKSKRRRENNTNSYSTSQPMGDDSFVELEPSKSLGSSSPSSPSRPSKRKLKKQGSSSKSLVDELDLQTISQTTSSSDSPDELLHISQGVIMTYRILDGTEILHAAIRTKEKVDPLRYKSILEVREKNFDKIDEKNRLDALPPEEKDPFADFFSTKPAIPHKTALTLIVIPDLTMTLDTLQTNLEILLRLHPELRIILVGLIGLPNTIWPATWVLNSELQSKCITLLLNHLQQSKKLFYHGTSNDIDPLPNLHYDDNLLFMGFGTGAYHLSRFLTLHTSTNLLPVISSAIKHAIFINGFLKINKKFKLICRDLRQALLRANIHESHELITSLHLFDQFLAQTDREEALTKFWSSRQALTKFGDDSEDNPVLGFKGVLEQLKGFVVTPDNFDGAMLLVDKPYPISIIQGTENVFIDPKQASIYSPTQLPPERQLVDDINQNLNQFTVYVAWLRAGHEIIQERTPYILSLLTSLMKNYGLETKSMNDLRDEDGENDNLKEKDDVGENSEVDDIMDVMKINPIKLTKRMSSKRMMVDEDLSEDFGQPVDLTLHNIEEDEENMNEIDLENSSNVDEISTIKSVQQSVEELSLPTKGDSEEKSDLSSKRASAMDKLQRAQLAIERRKRTMQQARKHELEALYEREQEELNKIKEKKELKFMAKEDRRSKLAAEYLIECEINELSKRIAKEKAKQLHQLRREEAIRKVEEDIARKRSDRIEERRAVARRLVANIENEELLLQGMKEGGYNLPDNLEIIPSVIESSTRLLKDLLECRQKYVEVIKRQRNMQEKTDLYKKQLLTIENEERRLRRAIRLIQINPSVVGDEMNAELQLSELKAALMNKQESLSEMQAVLSDRERQLYASNRSVQILKLLTKERDALMEKRFKELYAIEVILNTKLKNLKMQKENLVIQKDRLRIQSIQIQGRYQSLSKELMRVKNHRANLIDTDIWMEGVMQRCVTKELKDHIKTEITQVEETQHRIATELEEIKQAVLNISELIAHTRRDCDKLTQISKILFKTYQSMISTSLEETMNQLQTLQQKAQSIENRRNRENQLDKIMMLANNSQNLVDKVRLKEPDIRTKDERQFVGIDLILHPEEYLHLTTLEAEQMEFDEDYQCNLSKTDIDRILKLPENINLALPFLNTPEEVNTHRLINKFIRGKDDSSFRSRDLYSGDFQMHQIANKVKNSSSANSVNTSSLDEMSTLGTDDFSISLLGAQIVSVKDMQEAEVIHDILVKESIRDRLRENFLDEKLSDEEKQWIEIDKVLAPHIYGLEPLDPLIEGKRIDEIDKEVPKPGSSLSQNKPGVDSSSVSKKDLQAITTQVIKPAFMKKKPAAVIEKEKTLKINTAHEGDQYQALRDVFDHENDQADLFDYKWHCRFSKEELVQIHNSSGVGLKTEDELLVKKLMEKYYVTDEESILGHGKLKLFQELSHKIYKSITKADKKARNETILIQQANSMPSSPVPDRKKLPDTTTPQSVDSRMSGDNDDDDDLDSLASEDDPSKIHRLWGSWSQVHPASQGKESQTNYFMLSTFNVSRDHPAAFAMHEKVIAKDIQQSDSDDDDDEDDDGTIETADDKEQKRLLTKSQNILGRDTGIKLLTDPDSVDRSRNKKGKSKGSAIPKTNFFICDSIGELSQQDPLRVRGKIVLLRAEEPLTLFEIKDAVIAPRQSRSHYFSIPDRESIRVLELTVSIVFQGQFNTNGGYKLGRLAASLFRLPPEQHGNNGDLAPSLPLPIGFSPYDSVSPNLPDTLGRIAIFHRPKIKPMSPGNFQIIIGSASSSKYSVEVTARYARSALPVVDEHIDRAKGYQARLPVCLAELDTIFESIRLTERKLLVCEKMMQEAEVECDRTQSGIMSLTQKLEKDDEDMLLLEDERKDLIRELSILEAEYAQWSKTFASRIREKDDIKDGIKLMYKFKREREEEKEKIQKTLDEGRSDLPACIRILRNMTEAVNVAVTLNTVVQGVSEEAGAAATGDWGGIRVSTPAEDVRRALKQYGFSALSLEEQQWCLLDQAVQPHKYEWLREQEEKEKQEKIALGKPWKEPKISAALEPFKLSKSEIEYIMETPFSMLNRREVVVRKLLTKYHDDVDAVKRSISAVAYNFDPHLAERVRAKHPRTYTKEEQEWSTVDRIIHPEIWEFYVNRSENFLDRHMKEATIIDSESTKKNRNKIKRGIQNKLTNNDSATLSSSLTNGSLENSSIDNASSVPPNNVISLENEDFDVLVQRMQQSAAVKLRNKVNAEAPKEWNCPFDLETILKIWRTPRHFLKTDDERRVHKLLHKFNGSYQAYFDILQQSNRRKAKFVKSGAHIQWEKLGKLVSKDVDYRARQILREIDRAATTRNEYIHSDVLHANDQRFPTKVLLTHLHEALDVLLSEQIKDRERAERYKIELLDADDDDDDEVPITSENTPDEGGNTGELLDGIGVGENGDKEILSKVQKRSKHRIQRKKRVKELTQEEEVLKTKSILNQANRSSEKLADLLLTSELGNGSCLACRTKRCQWHTSIDLEICKSRKQEIADEIERVRLDRDSAIFESSVALSSQLGGNKIFKRNDLLNELNSESYQIELRMDLDRIDKELHDAYASRKEYFESRHLHGYTILLWTNNARVALEQRQNRLIALIISQEVVDDILEDMLEGWVFGERQSNYRVMGHVPTIKKDGNIRAGQDQITTVVSVVSKMRKRAELRRQGMVLDEEKRGKMMEKSYEIELQAQDKKEKLKIAREGNEHEHLLNETEQTLRFGLFMLSLMYFRAMTFLKREQRSWAGEDDEIGIKKDKINKFMTDERMRMLDEENRVKQRKKKIEMILGKCKVGDARRKERELNERKEAIQRLQAVVRRQRLELMSIVIIQKMYRGHLGRQAAKRWALKRAELNALNALLNSTAIAIQRVYRGYRARVYAIWKRMEMAQFIALMRVQESAQDEEVYWQTHPWSRFKRRQKEWVNQKMEKYRQNQVLGGSRLSAEDQAKLEGKSLDDIRREIEGLGDDSDEEKVDVGQSSKGLSGKSIGSSWRSDLTGSYDEND